MITVSLETSRIVNKFHSLIWEMQNKHLRAAVTGATKVIEEGYRITLANAPMVGKLGNQSFVVAHTAVARKVRLFKDGNGSWGMVGIEAGPDGRSVAPQAWWAEWGTNERYTKLQQYRGVMPAQHYLARAVAATMPVAQSVFWQRLRERMAK